MRGLLAVAWREIVQQRLLFVAAAVAAPFSFLVPLLRDLHGLHATEVRTATALAFSTIFLFGVGAYLGSTRIPGAIADRRIAFDFSRPLSSGALWGGTLLGTLVLAIGSAAIAFLPAALTWEGSAWRNLVEVAELPIPWMVAVLAAILLVFGAFSVAGVALRSRSILLALDLFLAFVALEAGFLVIVRLQWLGMENPLRRLAPALGAVAIAALLVASYAAVARGRTAIGLARRTQSLALWGVLGAGLLGIHAWVSWLSTFSPRELASIESARPAPAGSWAYVNGQARGINADFLCDLETGRFERLGVIFRPVFSGDGKRTAWLERRGVPWLGARHDFALVTLRLDDSSSEPVVVPVPEPENVTALVLDDAGSRVAVVRRDEISVLALPGGEPLVSVRLALGESWPRGYFPSPDLFRLLNVSHADPNSSRLDLYELDLTRRALTQTASLASLEGWILLEANRSGTQLLIREKNQRLSLRDARDGRLLGLLVPLDEPVSSAAGRFLADGRIAVASRSPRGCRLRIFSPDAKPQLEIALPEGQRVSVGGEAAPGRLVVGVGAWGDQRLFLADLDSGRLELFAEHLGPVLMTNYAAPANSGPAPGAEASKLFYARDNSLIFLDPSTKTRRVLLGQGAH